MSLDGSATQVWMACPSAAVLTWASNVARPSGSPRARSASATTTASTAALDSSRSRSAGVAAITRCRASASGRFCSSAGAMERNACSTMAAAGTVPGTSASASASARC